MDDRRAGGRTAQEEVNAPVAAPVGNRGETDQGVEQVEAVQGQDLHAQPLVQRGFQGLGTSLPGGGKHLVESFQPFGGIGPELQTQRPLGLAMPWAVAPFDRAEGSVPRFGYGRRGVCRRVEGGLDLILTIVLPIHECLRKGLWL